MRVNKEADDGKEEVAAEGHNELQEINDDEEDEEDKDKDKDKEGATFEDFEVRPPLFTLFS